MIDNLKEVATNFVDSYIYILEELGEPKESYKYLAINTFHENWDLKADEFHSMFRDSFSKVSNLLYQNSWGFIEKASHYFPEEVREMFTNLYNEDINIEQRIKAFQKRSNEILPKLKEVLNRKILHSQQDERTISVYLAFRFPEKYILYKYDYYKNFCETLNIKPFKTGDCFLHLQDVATQIIESGLLNNSKFIDIYRSFYPKQTWNDSYLMIQNILYITFKNMKTQNDTKQSMKTFREFTTELDKYINDNNLDYKLGKPNKRDWVRIFDKAEYFNNKYIHYELVLVNNEISIDLHFENDPQKAQELHNLIGVLPDCLEWKKWQVSVDSISHKTKINFNNKDCVKQTIDVFNELFNKTSPLLIEKVKEWKGIPTDIMHSPNIILYGAPGTGKTFTLRNEYFPKYTVSEKSITPDAHFEEVVRDLTWWQVIALSLLEAGTSSVDTIRNNRWVAKKGLLSASKNIRPIIWSALQSHTSTESETVKTSGRQPPYIFDKTKDSRWELLETELKEQAPEIYTFLNSVNNFKPDENKEIKHYVFTTFHQSFSYEDFIEGIKPVMEEGQENISYQVEDGIFKSLCLKAQNDPEHRYAIFIDEINRGNISAIFGELITLIEPDKRIKATNGLTAKLPYSKQEFGVPQNVDIIGTMNTADRSVEALDTALRRRFSFIEMQPDPKELSKLEYTDVDLIKLLETINQRIEILIDKDHQIGHSYFLGIKNIDDLIIVFRDKIKPLLEEYFYGDFGKIGMILGSEFIILKENKVKFPKDFNSEYEFVEEKKVYQFTESTSWNEQTFISIYEE